MTNVPLAEVDSKLYRLANTKVPNGLVRIVAADCRAEIDQWLDAQKAKRQSVPEKLVKRLIEKHAAMVQRKIPLKKTEHVRSRQAHTLAKLKGEKMLEVARRISEKHLEAVKLRATGKGLEECATALGTSKSNVSNMMNVVKFHLRHGENTGQVPERRKPTVGSWKKAQALIEQYFPHLKGQKRYDYRRVAALAFENRLAMRSSEIYMQQKVVNKKPFEFSDGIRKTLQPQVSLMDLLEELRPSLEIAAKRGDQAAKTALDSKNSEIISTTLRRIQEGMGIASRHPDLFIGTSFTPRRIREIHPHALRGKLRVIKALAAKGETSGEVMLKFAQGKSVAEIAKSLNAGQEIVKKHLLNGAHVVFGIEPLANRSLIEYHRIIRQNPHLFAEPITS